MKIVTSFMKIVTSLGDDVTVEVSYLEDIGLM